jgi:hypothetical protein
VVEGKIRVCRWSALCLCAFGEKIVGLRQEIEQAHAEQQDAVEAYTAQVSLMRLAQRTRQRYATHWRVFDRYVNTERVRCAHPEAYVDGVFQLNRLTTDVFIRFLSSRRLGGATGGLPDSKGGYLKGVGYKSLGLDKSALVERLREAGLPKPSDLDARLKEYMRGVARDDSNRRQRGEVRSRVGKDEMDFSVYRWLAGRFLQEGDTFAHLFLLLTWNLINRAVNTKEMLYSHLQWKEDALVVTLPKSKTNQVGKQRPTPKHVYANPVEPALCPVLSFGVHSLLASSVADHGCVFPGGDQQNRFSKALDRVLRSGAGRDRLATLGLTLEDIGTHSVRKGASSYLLGGMAGGGPSVIAVLLRGEWTLGSVSDRYWKHQDAGDQYVGRVVAGLPIQEPQFGQLPPHFADAAHPAVLSALQDGFCNILSSQPHMSAVLTHALAQVVHHASVLRRILPAAHPLFSTRIFTAPGRLQELTSLLLVGRSTSTVMSCTGLPPHIIYLQKVEEIRQLLVASPAQSETLASTISAHLERRLQEMGVVGERVTSNYLSAQMDSFLGRVEDLMVMRGASAASAQSTGGVLATTAAAVQQQSPPQEVTTAAAASSSSTTRRVVYTWPDGTVCVVPHDFAFPAAPIRVAWELWHLGTADLLPYKCIRSSQLRSATQRKYLSNWKRVMSHMDQLAQRHTPQLWQQTFIDEGATPTASLLGEMYSTAVVPSLKFRRVYKERDGERTVNTVAELLRKQTPAAPSSATPAPTSRRRPRQATVSRSRQRPRSQPRDHTEAQPRARRRQRTNA